MPNWFRGPWRLTSYISRKTSETKEKLYKMMREHQAKGTCSHTFGALDTVQVRIVFLCARDRLAWGPWGEEDAQKF